MILKYLINSNFIQSIWPRRHSTQNYTYIQIWSQIVIRNSFKCWCRIELLLPLWTSVPTRNVELTRCLGGLQNQISFCLKLQQVLKISPSSSLTTITTSSEKKIPTFNIFFTLLFLILRLPFLTFEYCSHGLNDLFKHSKLLKSFPHVILLQTISLFKNSSIIARNNSDFFRIHSGLICFQYIDWSLTW